MTPRLWYGVFEDEDTLVSAVGAVRAAEIPIHDAYSPHPIHGLEEAMGIERSKLPWITFAGGATGLAIALLLQWWTHSIDWALDIGGKPFDAWPAYAPVAFELMILLAGLATAGGLFAMARLYPMPKAPVPDPRVTHDRYVLAVEERDGSFDRAKVERVLREHGAVDVRAGGAS